MLVHVTEGQVTPKCVRPEVTEAIVCAFPTGTMATCHRRSPEGVEGCTHAQLEVGFPALFSDVFGYVI
jgi:hypothetical protein